MTGRRDLLTNIMTTATYTIGLPNESEVMTTQQESVLLGPKFILHDILIIPNLKCNLISLVQLMKTKKYFIIMTDELCVIHNRILRTPIGVSEEWNGLFIYKSLQLSSLQVSLMKTIVYDELWHCRLGHPAYHTINKFLDQLSAATNQKQCFVCLRAKQTRYPFPLSLNKATTILDLIHCDL